MAAGSDSLPFEDGCCLFYTGSKSIAKDKLHNQTHDGLQTIRYSCELRGKTDLLAYLNANPTARQVFKTAVALTLIKSDLRFYQHRVLF